MSKKILDETYARLHDQRKQFMLELYEVHGLSMGEIAKKFDISRQRVAQIIGKRGDSAHWGAARQEANRQKFVEAHERILAGSNIHDEAARLDLKTASLYAAFAKHGLKLQKDSPQHGTAYRYSRGCRCDECKQGMREAKAKRILRGPSKHGTVSGYHNYGCRCIPCRQAAREERIRKRQERLSAHAI